MTELTTVLSSKKVLLPAVATVSLLSGAGVGFVVARKRLQAEYDTRLEAELAEAKDYYDKHYAKMHKAEEFSDPVKMAEALGVEVEIPEQEEDGSDEEEGVKGDSGDTDLSRAAREAVHDYTQYYKGAGPNPADKPPLGDILPDERDVNDDVPVTENIFDSSVSGGHFDYNEEIAKRDENPDKPYVISFEEWNESEEGYEQATLTYFEADDVLVDAQETMVDAETTIGAANLNRFGHGSNDAHLVYVRNEKLEIDFEVIHSEGSYVQEVLGMKSEDDDHIAHSARGGVRRFRRDED